MIPTLRRSGPSSVVHQTRHVRPVEPWWPPMTALGEPLVPEPAVQGRRLHYDADPPTQDVLREHLQSAATGSGAEPDCSAAQRQEKEAMALVLAVELRVRRPIPRVRGARCAPTWRQGRR